MDLKEFYFQNIKESEYHYRFLESVKKVNYTYNIFCGEEETQNYQFEIYDANDDSGKKYGDFYVDKDNGKIYKRNTKTEKLEEYKK